jgi:hypothetical protein
VIKAEQRPAHRPAKKTVNTLFDVNSSEDRPVGNSAAYALRKLRADRPDIHPCPKFEERILLLAKPSSRRVTMGAENPAP